MKKIGFLFIIVIVVVMITGCGSSPRGVAPRVVYPIEADTFVRLGEPDRNFGEESEITVNNSGIFENTRYVYLRFPLDNYPAGTIVESVTLRINGWLTSNALGGDNVPVYRVFPLLDNDWEENVITWNTRLEEATDTERLLATWTESRTGWISNARWYDIEGEGLVSYVQEAIDAGLNLISFALYGDDRPLGARFDLFTKENLENYPQLVVNTRAR